MANTATLHIKIDPQLARGLKRIAEGRGETVAELVRQAITACYQVDLLGLTQVQKSAVVAYKGGFISLGKLASAMGTTPFEMRRWLRERGIPENTVYEPDDTGNA
jgi:predicted transcriptional regulator